MVIRRLLLPILAVGLAAGSVAGQETPGTPDHFEAKAQVSAGARVTRLLSRTEIMAGASLVVEPARDFGVGVEGWSLTRPMTLAGATGGSDLELSIWYGGVTASRAVLADGLSLRVLLGAGNARIRLPVVETEIAADNFGVFEPGVGAGLELASRLGVRADASYRLVFGVEDLPQVASRRLRGFSASLSFSLGPL